MTLSSRRTEGQRSLLTGPSSRINPYEERDTDNTSRRTSAAQVMWPTTASKAAPASRSQDRMKSMASRGHLKRRGLKETMSARRRSQVRRR